VNARPRAAAYGNLRGLRRFKACGPLPMAYYRLHDPSPVDVRTAERPGTGRRGRAEASHEFREYWKLQGRDWSSSGEEPSKTNLMQLTYFTSLGYEEKAGDKPNDIIHYRINALRGFLASISKNMAACGFTSIKD